MPETERAHWLEALRRDPWSAALPDSCRAELLRALRLRAYAKDETLFHQGDAPDYLYCVLAGELEVNTTTQSGREHILTHLHPIRWFGELSFLDGLPRTLTVVARQDSRLGLVPGAVITRLMETEPAFYRAMVAILCETSRLLYMRFEDNQKRSVETLLASALLHYMAFRGGARQVRLSQQSIASLIGATRQTVNARLSQWEAAGVIARDYRCVTIRDLPRLRSIAAQ